LDQVIQQNASASEEMASTSEELSSQAEQLQSTISFFKLDDGNRKRTSSPAAKVQLVKHASNGKKDAATPSLMAAKPRGIKPAGIAIELGVKNGNDHGNGHGDAQDKEFTSY